MDRDAVRRKARAAVRRGIGKVAPLDDAVVRRNERRRNVARLVAFYDRVRAAYGTVPATIGTDGAPALPAPEHVDAVEEKVLDGRKTSDFIATLTGRGDLDPAVVALVTDLLASGDIRRARSIAQVLRHREGLEALGDICLALVVRKEPLIDESWRLFSRPDTWQVLRLASMEYFEVGFRVDPPAAVDVLTRTLAGDYPLQLPAQCWLQLAQWAFAAGADEVSAVAAARADGQLGQLGDAAERERVRGEVGALRAWYGRRAAALEPVAAPAGEVCFALLDYQQAGRVIIPISSEDAQNTALSLGTLVRHRGARFTGEDAGLATALQDRVPPTLALDGPEAAVRLVRVDRDATSFAAVPDGTWLLMSGTFPQRIFDLRFDLPLNPRLRPIFVGFGAVPELLHQPGVIEQLKRSAPIGCRDWRTVFMLQAAGIPAFFSGWLAVTADTVSGEPASVGPVGDGFAQQIVAAADEIRARRGTALTARRMAVYLSARSVGARVTFRPRLPNDGALQGLADITDAEFARLKDTTANVLATALGAILAGKSEADVYGAWREVCAPLVAAAEAERDSLPEIPAPRFDVGAAVRVTQAESVVVDRSQPGPDGPEINVELSLDGNYKHQLDVVLDSIVAHASRPIRAFVLCRDHSRADFDRMAKLFPTVSFVWLPTDDADYGPVASMLGHITVATMDRLLLPALLPDVDRIIHHDLDALCLADLAGLWDVPLGDAPLAARDQRHPFSGSGYIAMTRALPLAQSREKSRELMIRLSRRQPFDYRNFNAGVMVLNLAQMRSDDFVRQYLPYVERFGFNDQGVLNIYAGGQYYDFGREWNRYPRMEIVDDAKILHWIGGTKPWHRPFIEGQPEWRAGEARFAERHRAVFGH